MRHYLLRFVLLTSFILLPQAVFARQTMPSGTPANPPTTPPVPTMADLQQMYDAGDYQLCLQQVARIKQMSRPGMAANDYDPEHLQLLRGICLLSLNDPRSAQRVFQTLKESKQPDVQIRARGLALLISRSQGANYTPRVGDDHKPINIIDSATRKQALMALLNDEIVKLETDAKPALAADNLGPMLALLPRLRDLHAAEKIATGETTRTGPIAKAFGDRARDLITSELNKQDKQITLWEALANQMIEPGRRGSFGNGRWGNGGAVRSGLNSDQRQSLTEMIEYLTRIEDMAVHAQELAQANNGNIDAWNEVVAHAGKVKDHAQFVLDCEGIITSNGTK